jgi:hypothetical protein
MNQEVVSCNISYDTSVARGYVTPTFCNFFVCSSCLAQKATMIYPQVHTLNLLARKLKTANSTKFWKCGIAVICDCCHYIQLDM